ncbi:hypothetical protein JOD45_002034 [Scopulibacillus daqui]|uniref:Uncharacterized protein n=1 Tax=Scopulibacillus daqui TaxID=1469162 RepID=A0ABS2Q0J2_9BACL|nr:DUF3679 domain-containing protein [Scopulibacillus daqui]MBM7645815.1 hypothetical protein [Scopulibacillus daqui]
MKKFFIKTAILMFLLFFSVIYGMVAANHGASDIKGLNVPKDNVQPLSLNIAWPKTVNKTAQKLPTIEERAAQLKHRKAFNPYSSISDTMSNGLSDAFRKGMSITANLFDQMVHAVL